MKTGVLVSDAMTRKPIIASPGSSIREGAKLIDKKNIHSLMVTSGNKLLGIVTDGDFVRSAVIDRIDVDKTKIKDIMTTEILSIGPNEDIYNAIKLMGDNDIRHLPVIDNKGKFVGLITIKDILKINPDLLEIVFERIKVREEQGKINLINSSLGICEMCGKKGILTEAGGGLLICGKCIKKV